MLNTKQYRAGTRFIERENLANEKKWLVAADIGYSAVKIMSPTIMASFPSYAVKVQESGNVIGTLPESYIIYKDLDTNETWLVGKNAQDLLSDRDTSVSERALFGRMRYGDPMFKVIVRTGLAAGMSGGKYGHPAGKEIYVQTGFPPLYESDTEDLKEIIAGRHRFSIKVGDHPEQNYDFKILPENIFAIPQPMGTLYSVAMDKNGRLIPEMSGLLRRNVLVFDGGFGTLDIFPIMSGHLDGCQTNDQLGMKRVMQETAKELKRRHGIYTNVAAMQKYLETGKARYNRKNITKDIPFGDILEECSRKVCHEALEWLDRIYDGLAAYDYLIITGGTGAAWSDWIKEAFSQKETLRIIDGNCRENVPYVFANVRGYYLYRQARLR